MKTKYIYTIIIVVIANLLVSFAQTSSEINWELQPFVGLKDIAILVENLGPDGTRAGITNEEIEALVEYELLRAGIPVRDITDLTLESPYLYININLIYLDDIDHFIYSLKISLSQKVRLLRNDATISATTWTKELVAIVPREKAREDIIDSIHTTLMYFIIDYLAANS